VGQTHEGGGRPAGEDERGGRRKERRRSFTYFGRRRLAVSGASGRDHDEAVGSFPSDFRVSGVGNERGSGWNSGVPEGIRAEFRAQFPHPSKRWNSGPNSAIPNSKPNSKHPNEVSYFWISSAMHFGKGVSLIFFLINGIY
jgi:hypothetical protein